MRAKLIISRNGRTVRRCVIHTGETFEVGRGRSADIRLKGLAISRRHATFELAEEGMFLRDLGSRNGTQIGETPMKPNSRVALDCEQPVLIGPYLVAVSMLRQDSGPPEGVRQMVEKLVAADGIEIRHLVGRGANATVWSGYQASCQRMLAVKVLSRETLDDESRRRFLREGRVAGRIQHKNIIQLLDFRIQDGHPYLLLELVRGVSVMERMREGKMSVWEALEIAQHVALALGALAKAGVVHRDVKPSNVLLSPDGVAKLSDFGIAKDLYASSELTRSGVGLGTYSYMAPEQFQEASSVNTSADLYGLGATLFHMIGGRAPFLYTSGVSPLALVREIRESDPPSLRELRPDCPEQIADFVHRLLAKKPEDRPQPAEFVEAMLGKLRKQHCTQDTAKLLWESSSDTSTSD